MLPGWRWLIALATMLEVAQASNRGLPTLPVARPDQLQWNTPAWQQPLAFCLVFAINGGLVGAIGPSLLELQSNTGLGEAALGRAVMINRLTKLAGVFTWTSIGQRVQAGKVPLSAAKRLIAASTLVVALCTTVLCCARKSAAALQAALAVAGVSYGISDTAVTQLTLWSYAGPQEQRTQVALLNAAFTVGCALAPAVVAASLQLGGSCYASFAVLAALSVITTAVLICTPLAMREPPRSPPAAKVHVEDPRDPPAVETASTRATSRVMSKVASRTARTRARFVISAMCTVLFCVTGCEHGVGTWLPAFGSRVGHLDPAAMAVMSSAYWSTVCAGRVSWAALSMVVSSGWPVLFSDSSLMLIAALFFARFSSAAAPSVGTLWSGTLLLALGFASSLPCALTLPTEARVEITPARLLALNLAGSAGEMLCPYALGLAFERGQYWALGYGAGALQVLILTATLAAWRVSLSWA